MEVFDMAFLAKATQVYRKDVGINGRQGCGVVRKCCCNGADERGSL